MSRSFVFTHQSIVAARVNGFVGLRVLLFPFQPWAASRQFETTERAEIVDEQRDTCIVLEVVLTRQRPPDILIGLRDHRPVYCLTHSGSWDGRYEFTDRRSYRRIRHGLQGH